MIIWGFRTVTDLLGVVRFVCGHCQVDAPKRVYLQKRRFTLFFIPLFTYRKKYYVECVGCAGIFEVDRESAESLVQAAA